MTAQGDKKRSVFSIPFFVIRFKQKGRSGTSALLARRCASVSPVDVNRCLFSNVSPAVYERTGRAGLVATS